VSESSECHCRFLTKSISILGYSQLICDPCKQHAINAFKFRQMCLNSDDNMRVTGRRSTNYQTNEHDYSTLHDYDDTTQPNSEYDMDLSEYLINPQDPQEEIVMESEPLIVLTPAPDDDLLNSSGGEASWLSTKGKHKCPHCGKFWVSPSKLRRHIETHLKPVKEQNPEKKISFSAPTMYRSKNLPRVIPCPMCSKDFISASKLARHMSVHIRNPPPGIKGVDNDDDDDDEEDEEEEVQEKPIAEKLGKQRYRCTVCSSEFKTTAKLKAHMQQQHMRKLTSSEKKKSQEPPPSKTTCTVCGGNFPSVGKLERHMKLHKKPSAPRPRRHACQFCEKMFETPSKLLRHMTVHKYNPELAASEKPKESSPPPASVLDH